MIDGSDVFPPGKNRRRQVMRTPDEVSAMQRLHNLGWVRDGCRSWMGYRCRLILGDVVASDASTAHVEAVLVGQPRCHQSPV